MTSVSLREVRKITEAIAAGRWLIAVCSHCREISYWRVGGWFPKICRGCARKFLDDDPSLAGDHWPHRRYKKYWPCPVCGKRHRGMLYVVQDGYGIKKRVPRQCLEDLLAGQLVTETLDDGG